jgi:hypothetical protein
MSFQMMKLAIFLLVATTVCSARKVGFNYDAHFQGAGNVFELNDNGQCVNFADQDIGQISAVNTGGGCVILFVNKECQGHSAKLSLGADNQCVHADLSSCNFDNRAASIKSC